jgi:hypothetical protein
MSNPVKINFHFSSYCYEDAVTAGSLNFGRYRHKGPFPNPPSLQNSYDLIGWTSVLLKAVNGKISSRRFFVKV